jgi:hypothetical protein
MLNIKTLSTLVFVSIVALSFTVQAKTTLEPGTAASPAMAIASKGKTAKTQKKKKHASKSFTKKNRKVNPLVKKSHKTTVKQPANSKGPGLEAY